MAGEALDCGKSSEPIHLFRGALSLTTAPSSKDKGSDLSIRALYSTAGLPTTVVTGDNVIEGCYAEKTEKRALELAGVEFIDDGVCSQCLDCKLI